MILNFLICEMWGGGEGGIGKGCWGIYKLHNKNFAIFELFIIYFRN